VLSSLRTVRHAPDSVCDINRIRCAISPDFAHTDKLGNEKEWIAIDDITFLISEYTANIENLFNFDVKVAKHVRVKAELLKEIWQTIQQNNFEQSFQVSEVRNIG
jgi:predicted XRE-type DNA-binding protein